MELPFLQSEEVRHVCCTVPPTKSPNWRASLVIAEILYAYVRLMRMYRGTLRDDDQEELPVQVHLLCECAQCLATPVFVPASTIVETVAALLRRVEANRELRQTAEIDLLCWRDVCALFERQENVAAALEDLQTLVGNGMRLLRQKDQTRQLRRIKQKLDFAQSFNAFHFYSLDFLTPPRSLEPSSEGGMEGGIRRIVTLSSTTLAAVLRTELAEHLDQLQTTNQT